jgi:hypothetical protein
MNPLAARAALAALLIGGCASTGRSMPDDELPRLYYALLDRGMPDLETRVRTDPEVRTFGSAILAPSVLYAHRHPANPRLGDRTKLELAFSLGDLLARESEGGRFSTWLNHQWIITLWLDSYRLLERDLGDERRARWRKEIEKNLKELETDVAERLDYPRFQSPFIRTSPNHLSIWSSTLHLAGRVLGNPEWERLGGRAMHRFAVTEQTPDGYWGEHSDSGPTTGYNYLTFTSMALYYEHSRDPAALEALRRGTDFHTAFTWPDGTPVDVINDRNRHWDVSPWGHFGFSNFPDGRRYADFLMGHLRKKKLGADALGRLAQNALYFHEGPRAPIPQDASKDLRRMKVPAAIRRSAPWTVCLSGILSTQAVTNQFYLDRQGHVSITHDALGPIVTGANSKRQPELATFSEKAGGQVYHLPTSSRLETGESSDRLSLAYNTFFADLRVGPATESALPLEVTVVERGRVEEAFFTLQLRLRPGEALETAKTRVIVGAEKIDLGGEELGGRIRHAGWTLRTAAPGPRLVWPVYPFNPYANGPETKLEFAVAALSIPLKPVPAGERLKKQSIALLLETGP